MTRPARILLLALLAILGYAPARAAAACRLGVDPRIELLGVVQYLAGAGRQPLPEAYRRAVEGHFGKFRGHRAVTLYKEANAPGRPRGTLAVDLLYLTEPPSLRLAEGYVALPTSVAAPPERFIEALRDFAAASDFMGFYRSQAPTFRGYTAAAQKALAGDPVRRIEEYLGVGLNARCTGILSPIYDPGTQTATIVPYPGTPEAAALGKQAGPFEAVVFLGDPGPASAAGAPFLDELLYVFAETTLASQAGRIARSSASFEGLQSRCGAPDWISCVKHLMVWVLARRLKERMDRAPARPEQATSVERALYRRLSEYERQRDRYPRFTDFYPKFLDALSGEATSAKP